MANADFDPAGAALRARFSVDGHLRPRVADVCWGDRSLVEQLALVGRGSRHAGGLENEEHHLDDCRRDGSAASVATEKLI